MSTMPPTTSSTSSSSSSSSSSSTTSSTTTSTTTTSTTTTTTTTAAPTTTTTTGTSGPCPGLCIYVWNNTIWVLDTDTCTENPGCFCFEPPPYPGSYYGEVYVVSCNTEPPSTTTTTSTTTSTTSTAPPTTTTTTSTGTTTSSTTTTTTTEQPCTGSCTWQWRAELQKWIKVSGGNGTCSTGCSCSYPASNGTTDGEIATPACKRLTCTKCCGNADCCPIQYKFCCSHAILPKKLYITFQDPNNAYPCIDGVTIPIDYFIKIVSDPNSCFYYGYQTKGPIPTYFGTGCVGSDVMGGYDLPACKGQGYVVTDSNCSNPDYRCSDNVGIAMQLVFGDGCFPSCKIYLDIFFLVNQYVNGACRTFCGNDVSGLTLEIFQNLPSNCSKPIYIENNISFSSKCANVSMHGTFVNHGLALANTTFKVIVTE